MVGWKVASLHNQKLLLSCQKVACRSAKLAESCKALGLLNGQAKVRQGKARLLGGPGQVKSENGNNLGHKRKKAINDENERERAQVSTKISGRTSEREKERE